MNWHRTDIGWPLRVWFLVELFFAVSASLSVGLQPAHTATNFAWTIKPEVMASLMGAFYLALAPVVVLALFARRWEMVRVFVIPGMLFTFAQLVVTLLHWDRFAVGTGAFNIWFASYLLPPPVFLACYLWQQRHHPVPSPRRLLARWQYVLLLALGAAFTAIALAGLFRPGWFEQSAPWKISPLNARALGGYLLLLGSILLSMARERDRDRVRIVAPFLAMLLPVIAIQLARFPGQVDWSSPALAALGALLAIVAALGVSLLAGGWRTTMSSDHPAGIRDPLPTLASRVDRQARGPR